MPDTITEQAYTGRYYGSIEEYRGAIVCAIPEGEWTGPETSRYTLVLWDRTDGAILRHARHRSVEFGGVTLWGPGNGPCICRCGSNHDRYAGPQL
jgi:hypothetical protein